jgi:hypothetical protein
MTEAEWLHCDNPALMTVYLFQRPGPSERKVRLLACAYSRKVWPLLTDDRGRRAIEVTERNADGTTTANELAKAYAQARDAWNTARLRMQRMGPGTNKRKAALEAAALQVPVWVAQPDAARRDRHWLAAILVQVREALHSRLPGTAEERHAQRVRMRQSSCRLMREVFGNPFRPLPVDPAWRMPGVVELARTIYADRAFDRMPELADALEEAGCTDAELLAHLRGPGSACPGLLACGPAVGEEVGL